MKKLCLVSLLLISLNAFAAPPTITGAAGFSKYSNLKTPVIFGGMVGSVAPTDGVHTVDTCAMNGMVLQACNTESIYGGLELKVFAKHRSIGNLLLTHEGSMIQISARMNPDFVGVRWDTLCEIIGNGSCDSITTTATGIFRVHVDRNSNGIVDRGEEGAPFIVKVVHVPNGFDIADGTFGMTNFSLVAGNKRVMLTEPEIAPPGSLFTAYGAPIRAVRVFMSPYNMTDATPGSGLSPIDLKITPRGTITNATVTPLMNGQRMFFRVGMVDEAGNVISLFPPAGTEACDTGGKCRFAVTPGKF